MVKRGVVKRPLFQKNEVFCYANSTSGITDEFVAWVEEKLNNRPRMRLGYLTPNEKFNLLLTN